VELQAVLNLSKKPEVIECFDISNISDTHKVASMVCFRYGKADSSSYRRYRIKSVQGQDDFASMAEVIKRRFTRLKIEQKNLPDLIVVDGGKGQISAAYEQLKHLGLESQALIGLAKQNEEIFFHDTPTPLVLPRESGALKLLQRLRDEAHRFANGYHQLLMKKRMRESILDNCEGISRSRKQALLEHFGSVERIRKATPEQLAEVKGISKKLASELYQFFKGTSGN
jgi:excinuclease ABC subunit C